MQESNALLEMLTTLDPMVTESNSLQPEKAPGAMFDNVELITMWPLQHAIEGVMVFTQSYVVVVVGPTITVGAAERNCASVVGAAVGKLDTSVTTVQKYCAAEYTLALMVAGTYIMVRAELQGADEVSPNALSPMLTTLAGNVMDVR